MPGIEFAGEAVDVGAGGEELVHDIELAAAVHDARRQRTQRRAHHAVVDQLAAGQALGIARPLGVYAPAGKGDQVGGGAADVDPHAVLDAPRRERGTRMPVGRGDLAPTGGEFGVPAPAGCRGVEVDRALQRRGKRVAERQRADFPVREQVDHFAGHGGGMRGARALRPAAVRRGDGLVQVMQALPQWASPLCGVAHLQPGAGFVRHGLHQAGLEMGAADVPADDPFSAGHAAPSLCAEREFRRPGCDRALATGPHRRK